MELVQNAQCAVAMGARKEAGEGKAVARGLCDIVLLAFASKTREGRCWYVLVFVGCAHMYLSNW